MIEQSPSWQNFVIFHKNLIDEHYTIDPSFNHQYYTFLKTNPKFKANFNKTFGYRILVESDLEYYDEHLQKNTYMAPSAIYHIYKNNLHKEYNYIGFLEYDIKLESNNVQQVTQHFTKTISQKPKKLIMPYSYMHPLSRLSGQNKIKINDKNAILQIINDYNDFYHTDHDPDMLMDSNELITSQQSFLCDVKTFEKLMSFISYVIEERLCERPDSWHRPSTLMDRYFGLSLHLIGVTHPFSLVHENMQQWEDPNSGWRRFLK